MSTLVLTNSRMRSFQACARAHQYRYNEGYRSLAASEALEFGTVMHAGLEAWWKWHMNGLGGGVALSAALVAISSAASRADTFDEAIRCKADVMMLGYDARWSASMEDYEVLAIERSFDTSLLKATGRKARGVRLAGKLDALARRRSDGAILIVEHKTSGADLSPGSTYWNRLRTDSQISAYFDGAASLKVGPIAGVLYDVLGKVSQRPLKATPTELRKYTQAGRLYANQRENDEAIEEFRARIAEAIASDPESYFQRQEVVRLDGEITAARADMHEVAQLIQITGRKGIAPRTVAACHSYGRECEFLEICEGRGSLDDETKFRKLVDIHPELTA